MLREMARCVVAVGPARSTILLVWSRHSTTHTVAGPDRYGTNAWVVPRFAPWYNGPGQHDMNNTGSCEARHEPDTTWQLGKGGPKGDSGGGGGGVTTAGRNTKRGRGGSGGGQARSHKDRGGGEARHRGGGGSGSQRVETEEEAVTAVRAGREAVLCMCVGVVYGVGPSG